MLTVGSLFSGVGGFEQGFEAAGFRTAWQCEIDRDATDVLARHWPDVQRFSDVREIDPADLEPVDVVVFGSPCQGFSVAGRGEGLEDERSGLFHEAVRIIRGVRPAFAVWENVPGAYSANDGRDFGAVLAALAELGALDISWRVLDAQWFGVPQRRRRIFLVADFGGERAASVLFESESVRGDSQASSEARQGFAGDAENGFDSGGIPILSPCLVTTEDGTGASRNVGGTAYIPVPAVAGTLNSSIGRGTGGAHETDFLVLPVSGETVAHCLTAHGGSHGRIDAESETFVVGCNLADSLTVGANQTTGFVGDVVAHVASFSVRHFERALAPVSACKQADTGATGNMLPAVIVANADRGVTHCLTASHGATEDGAGRGTPRAASHDGMSVRRLTPRECEALMGWPAEWTRWRADGREIPDGPRYRMCGNGVVAPVAEWIARRLYGALEVA